LILILSLSLRLGEGEGYERRNGRSRICFAAVEAVNHGAEEVRICYANEILRLDGCGEGQVKQPVLIRRRSL
jgi:hypothetical protein